MAEQFWYTSCRVGLEGTTGIQVRAASPEIAKGLREFRIRLGGVLNYSLPEGGTSFNTSSLQSPIALSWIVVGHERILLRKSFIGFDSDRRPGNFFTHLISNLPRGFNARQAIATWDADFWQSSDQSLAPDNFSLEVINDWLLLNAPSPFHANELNAELRAKLETLLKAFLSRDAKRKIYIAAEPRIIALLVWGLTQCLPPQLCDDITFSTYESNVLSANSFITGTCRLEHLAQSGTFNLPQECYAGFNVALNLYPGARADSNLTVSAAIATFASFAVDSLWKGDRELQAILDTVATESHVTVDSLIETFNRERTEIGKWDAPTVCGVLKNPARAQKYLANAEFADNFIATAISNPLWWTSDAKPALEKLRQPGMASQVRVDLTGLGVAALQRAASEIAIGIDANRAILVDGIAAVCIPDQMLGNVNAYSRLLDILAQQYSQIPDAKTPIKLRAALVERWGNISPLPSQYKIEPWLKVSWDQANELLQLKLPKEWQDFVADELVKSLPPQWNIVEPTFYAYPDLFQNALVRQIASPSYSSNALALFKLAWENGYADKEKLLFALLRQDNAPANQILSIANLGSSTFERMLGSRQERETLLRVYLRSSVTQRLVQSYIDNLSIAKCKDQQTYDILRALNPYLNQATSSRAQAWLTIAQFIQTAQFTGTTLKPVAREIQFLFPTQREQKDAVQQLVSTLARRLDGQDGTEALRNILVCLGEPFDDSPVPLCEKLLSQAEQNYLSDNDHIVTRFVPFFQLYLRHYNREYFDARQKEQLKPLIKRVLESIQSSDRRGIDKLGAEIVFDRSKSVDADYQSAWNNLLLQFGLGGVTSSGPHSFAAWTSKIPFLHGFGRRQYAVIGVMCLALCMICAAIVIMRPQVITQGAVAFGQWLGVSGTEPPGPKPTKRATTIANNSPTPRPTRTRTQATPTVENPIPTATENSATTPTLGAPEATSAPLTIEPIPTQPTQTILPTLPPSPTQVPATPCPAPIRVLFRRETFLDGSIFKPGEKFTKTWTLLNSSPCKLDSLVLVFKPEVAITNDGGAVTEKINNGISMQAPESIPQPSAEPRAEFTVSVELTAPKENGRYWSTWELRTQSDQLLRAIFAEICVSQENKCPP